MNQNTGRGYSITGFFKVGAADNAGTVTIDLLVSKEVRYGRLAGELRLEFIGEEKGTLTVPFAGYVAGKSTP